MKPVRILLVVLGLSCTWLFAQAASEDSPENAQKKPLTVEAIVRPGGLTGRAPENVQWSPDSSRLSYVLRDDSGAHGQLWTMDPATGEKKVLVSEGKLSSLAPDVNKIKNEIEKERILRYSVAAYHWSPDAKHILFDSLGQLWLFSLESGTAVQFTAAPEPSDDPQFAPNGERVAYIRKHNLYVRPVSGDNETQLTGDKDQNLLNGEVDWLYAEELNVRSNYFWAPDSSALVFLQMDETRVPVYPITDWIPINAQLEFEKYPKPGDPNPAVRLGVVSARGGKVRWIAPSDEQDIYIPRFGWVRDGVVWAEVLNRTQDKLDLYFIDAKSGRSHKMLSEQMPDAWVPVTNDFKLLKSNDRFTWSSWRNGHMHIYLYSFDKGNPLASDAKLERQLTKGEFEVLGVAGIDDEAGLVYISANEGDPRQENLYSVKLDGTGWQKLSKDPGTHNVNFSPNAKYYVDAYSASLVPPRRFLCAAAGTPCHELWQSRSVAEYGLIAPKNLELKAEDGSTLYGQLVLPSDAFARVPLVVYVYGGPAAQLVKDQWSAGVTDPFNQLLAQHGMAIFSVDNRGTPHRGVKFEAALRHQFGAVELKDQLTALDQLFAQYPLLDKDHTCIWGWSNGGSMTLYSLLHSEAFRCGISGAPVTDWRLYDSAYTERYLGLPKQNPKPYEQSLPAAAGNLKASLLLIHGTSDDNVHFQNSIQMIDGLINNNKQFRLMLYPGKTHGVTGNQRLHLYHMMLDFFEDNLDVGR